MTPDQLLFGLRILAALALYGFLSALLLFLWRDLRAAGEDPWHAPEAHLVILEGEHSGERYPLQPTTDVGRGAGNMIQLEDETVSAQHARISYQGGQWWLEDLASRNGTMVNELMVQEPLVITYGDELSLGRVSARIESGPVPEGERELDRSDVSAGKEIAEA